MRAADYIQRREAKVSRHFLPFNNPYIMKQFDILLIIFLGLWAIGWVVIFLMVRDYCKNHRIRSDEDQCIDIPGMYDDVEYAERPYITYN
jgi:hypothetical protein